VLQEVSFTPVNARFFRFTALKEIGVQGLTSAAEISVFTAEVKEAGRKKSSAIACFMNQRVIVVKELYASCEAKG